MSSMFAKKLGKRSITTGTDKMIEMVENVISTSHISTQQVAQAAFSMESLNDSQVHSLETANNELNVALESIIGQLGISKQMTKAQIDAGTVAGLLSGDMRGFMAQKFDAQALSTEHMRTIMPVGLEDAMFTRIPAMEAYDDRENRNAAVYSIVYNMQASRQDEFGETFFPTIVVSPDNVGFDINVRLMSVYNEVQRNVSGALDNFNKRNIIRAIADYTIIKNEMTRIVPVYRAQSADKFVANGFVPSYNFSLEGEIIPTAPLACGVKFSLLGLSQTDALLANGVMDMTDSIDPAIKLVNAYVQFPDTVAGGVTTPGDKLKFVLENLPTSEFTYTTQQNTRVNTLNFDTTSVVLTADTKNIDGSALHSLAAIVSNNYTVRLAVTMNGSVNVELGDTAVYGSHIGVFSVQDSAGNQLDLTSGVGLAIVQAVATAKIAGYDLRAYRTNANRRQRGQLVDTTFYTQRYNVPLRSPITAIRPVNSVDQTDAPYLQTLITATRVRLSNQAVTKLVEVANALATYVPAADTANTDAQASAEAEVLGTGRFYIIPKFYSEAINMTAIVDSLTSVQRPADMQAALVNKIRDYAFRMYRDSQYKSAADALAGGVAPIPTVIIGTDPVIARYLTVTGDLRTLGGEFDVRVVSSLDFRVAGKIFLSFGVFDENRNVAPNPLNFGNLAWAPELTMTIQATRNGAISKETVVQPRFLFIANLPIMTVLSISNLPDCVNKIPLLVDTHAV